MNAQHPPPENTRPNERIHLYLDGSNRWRWRWWRGSHVIGHSSRGYSAKRDAIRAMEGLTGGIYVRTYESRRNESRRAYQQGVLRVPLGLSVFVETTPWEPT